MNKLMTVYVCLVPLLISVVLIARNNLTSEIIKTGTKLYIMLWKRGFVVFRTFRCKNEPDKTVKSMAKYGVLSWIRRVLS